MLAWALFAEPWAVLSDGAHYLAAARGDLSEPPFAYRLLGPWLAAGLAAWTGLTLKAAYGVVTWAALVTTTVLFALIGQRQGGTRRAALTALLWTGAFAVAFSASVGVVADALYLLAVVAAVWVGGSRRSVWLVPVVALGVLGHEMALFGLLAVGADRLVGSRIVIGERRPPWVVLVAAGVAGVAVIAAVQARVPVAEATIPNWTGTSALGLAAWAIEYAGGPVRYAARIFAAYGPVALMALGALAFRPARDRMTAVGLVGVAVALTFLATDTLRVMAMAGVVVLPLAAHFVDALFARTAQLRRAAWSLLGTQAAYSCLVYGHLRSFEGSLPLQIAAGLVSLAALVLVVWSARALGRSSRRQAPDGVGSEGASSRGDGQAADGSGVPVLLPELSASESRDLAACRETGVTGSVA